MPAQPRIAVIGAGAFGGWTALMLARRGARVTLVDAWGPGNTRASSGGETRVIRATYGTRRIYTALAVRALQLWREHDAQWQTRFFRQTGALWLFEGDDGFGRASADALAAHDLPHEWLAPADLAARYPQISTEDVRAALFEPEAGYLLARRACEHVAQRLEAEGGLLRAAAVRGAIETDGALTRVVLNDGSVLEADVFVFACGPWMGALFPDVLGSLIQSTRQEVFYFGTEAGDRRYSDAELPVWLDFGERLHYGIPGNANRGFKLADDTSGELFDPTHGSRAITGQGVAAARAFIARRFPALARAPFLGGEVCQYESTPDSHFIVDRHPRSPNVWLIGGGSGHGFKMGPALGEMAASAVMGGPMPASDWSLARFAPDAPLDREKWS
jgi:monomeric sarcosine oxidase